GSEGRAACEQEEKKSFHRGRLGLIRGEGEGKLRNNPIGEGSQGRQMSEFEQLVDAHYGALYRFALSLAKNADTAADLVQQTFCIWAQKGHQLEDRSKAK